MKSTEGMRLHLSRLACKNAAMVGFTPDEIKTAFANPEAIYANKKRDGQYIIESGRVIIFGVPDGEFFRGITMGKRKVKNVQD